MIVISNPIGFDVSLINPRSFYPIIESYRISGASLYLLGIVSESSTENLFDQRLIIKRYPKGEDVVIYF